MQNEIGIAGWLYSRQILHDKTLTLLDFPSVCASHGIKTVEFCSAFFDSQKAQYLNELRIALEVQVFPYEILQLIWGTWLAQILRFDELILRA